ncbi:MAG TPA: hypothetical protein VJM12_18200 [Pyrinomonadaceae bacterium]|nr:hypothetical protein [Pyrinomonadaceae bacterium]
MIRIRIAILSMVSGICVAVSAASDPSYRYPADFDSGLFGSEQSAPKLIDKFGALRSDDEKARLDNFAIELQTNPRATGYIMVFRQKGGSLTQAKKRAKNAKDYLVSYRKLDESRLVVPKEYCERSRVEYELWIVWNTDFNELYQQRCTSSPAKRTIPR